MKLSESNTRTGTATLRIQVKELREKAELTQEMLAKRSGIGLRFVRDLEQGKPTVRVDKVNQVLALFGYRLAAIKDQREAAS